MNLESLIREDPEIFEAIRDETERQQRKLVMIASENFASPAVLAAGGSVFTNKYAEGYPGARYYGGCELADRVETAAIERARKLFGAQHANVQPHAGSQANMAVYFSVLKPGDTILGMDLAHGGHLTHGSPASFSGRLFRIQSYGIDPDTETINMEKVRELAQEHRPQMIVAGASAYPRTIYFQAFADIAAEVGAFFMADMAHLAGLVAAGVHPSPVPAADFVTTTTHKTLRGPRGGMILTRSEHARKIDSAIFPGLQGGPLVHVIAAKAVALKEAMAPEFVDYSKQVIDNAKKLAENLNADGFRLVSGGTDNHLMLVDLRNKGLTGAAAETALDKAGITVNKNAVPFDPQPPRITSGIRIGTPALTTRGMREPEMDRIAEYISQALARTDDDPGLTRIREKVEALSAGFPLYAQGGLA